jgi:VanZ family protein
VAPTSGSARGPDSGRAGRIIDIGLWGLTAVLVALVLQLSLGPPPELPFFSLADKVGHAMAYAAVTLSALLAAVWRPGRARHAVRPEPPAVLLAIVALGALIEVAQAFVGRDASVFDLAADAAGALVGFGVWSLLRNAVSR